MVKRITFFVFVIAFNFQNIYGQFVVGASTVDNAAQFEVVATNKGVLLPRVQLKGTNDVTTVSNVSIGLKESLLVYNTAEANDVIPGYYYWDKNKWVPLIGTDNQDLTLSGNTLSIDRGNSVNLGSLKDNLGNHTASESLKMGTNEIQGAGSNTLINGVEVGEVGFGGSWGGLANKDQATKTGYALIQNDQGITLLNTQDGQKISFRVANDEKMIMTSNGSFGIGVTSPSAKLDVNGNTRIRSIDVGATSDQVLTVDVNGNVRKVTMSTVGGQGNTDNQDLTLSGNTLSIDGGNSVNLGSLKDNLGNHTASESLKMGTNEIQGAGSNTLINGVEVGEVGLGGSWGGLANKDQATKTGYALIQNNEGTTLLNTQDGQKISFRVANDEKMIMTSNGSFGIGVTSPSAKLDVNGNTRIRSIDVGATSDQVLTVDVNGNVRKVTMSTVGGQGNTDNQDLTLSGNTLSIDGGNSVNLGSLKDNLGNHTASESLKMGTNEIQGAGSNTLINGVEVGEVGLGGSWGGLANKDQATKTGYALIQNDQGITLLNTQDGQKISFRVANDEKMIMTSNGSFGIGVTSPSAKLDVNGNTRIRSIDVGATSDQVLTVDVNGNVRKVTMSTVGGQGNTDNQDLTLSGNTLSIDGGNSVNLGSLKDNLGNHTASESLKMGTNEIQGAGSNTLINGVEVGEVGLGGSWGGLANKDQATKTGYALIQNNEGTTLLNTQDGQKISFRVANDEKMIMTSNGSFGIGVTSPSAKLDVNGNTRIRSIDVGATSDQVLTVDVNGNVRKVTMSTVGGQGNTDNQDLTLSGNTLSIDGGNSVNLGSLKDNLGNHTASESLKMGTNEIQGAGSNTLINGVEVGEVGLGGSWGGLANKDQATKTGYALIQNDQGITLLNTQDGQKISFRVANDEKMIMTSNGSFGIGVTSPSAKLDVNGNTRIRSIDVGATSDQVLTVDVNGNVRKVTMSTVGGQGNTDNQDLTLSGNTLSIDGGNSVNLGSLKDNLGNHTASESLKMGTNEIQGAGSNTLINGVEVGEVGLGGSWGGLANKDQATKTGYALIQNNEGTTLLNTQDGQKISFRVANDEKMIMTSNGSFGIGVTSPSAKLDVNGNTRIRSIDVGATSDQVLTVDVNGNVRKVTMSTVGGQGNTDNQDLTLSGNTLSIDGGNSVNLGSLKDNLGNHTASESLKMGTNEIQGAGSNTLINGVEVGEVGFGGSWGGLANKDQATKTGYALIQNDQGITLLNTQDGQKISFRVANDEKMIMTSNGSFGIGVTSPSAKLDVNGNTRIRSIDVGATSDQVLTVDVNGNVRKVTMSTVGGQGNTDNQDLTLSGNTLSIDGGNSVNLGSLKDNLGNHTASESLKMGTNEIQGAGSNTLINGVEVGEVGHRGSWVGLANKDQATTTGYALIQNNEGITLLNTQSDQKIGFRVANDEKMTMTSNGSFGIGVTSPSAKLDVNGNTRIRSIDVGATSDQVLTVDVNGNVRKVTMSTVGGQGNTDNQDLTLSGNTLSIEGGNSVSLSTLDIDNQDLTLSGNILSIDGGNSVNLGSLKDNLGNHTASESLKMGTNEIQGAGSNTLINGVEVGEVGFGGSWGGLANKDQATKTGYALIQNDQGITLLNTQDGQKISFRVANDEKMIMTSNGSFGIGVTSPSAKLDVNGNTRIRSIDVGATSDQVLTVDVNGNVRKVTMSTVGGQGNTDNQDLTLSGNTLSIDGGNSVNLGSLKDNLGNHTASESLKMGTNEIQGAGSNTLINGVEVGEVGLGGSWGGLANKDQATKTGYALIQNNEGTTLLNTQDGQKISFRVANDEKMIMTSNGSFGIGVTSPSAKLDVNGNTRIRSIDVGATSDQVLTVDVNGNVRKVTMSTVGGQGNTDNQDLTLSGNTLSIDGGNSVNLGSLKDNLGNHTASESLKMGTNEIQGAGSNTLINGVEVGEVGHRGSWVGLANKDQATTTGYALIQNNEGITLLNTQSDQKIGFRVANDEKMTMTSNGSFGIGVTSPSAKLDVNGNTRIRSIDVGATSDQVLTVDVNGNVRKVTMSTVGGQGNTDNQDLTLSGNTLSIEGGNSVSLSTLDIDNQDLTLSGNILSIDGGNSVNLGSLKDNLGNHTASESLKMGTNEIQGAGSNTLINGVEVGEVGLGGSWGGLANKDQATKTGYALIQNNEGRTLLNTQDGQKISFRVANDEKMIMTSNGSFGIGVTSPSAKLDVNGNTRIRSIDVGATSDQVLTVDGNGNVRKVTMSTVGGQGNTDNQDLTLSGNTLSIEGGNSVSLSTLDIDNQDLTLSGNTLSIDGGNSVNLGSLKDNLGNHTASESLKMGTNEIQGAGSNTLINGVEVGEVGFGGSWGGLANKDQATKTGYALIQNDQGITLLNTQDGQKISFRVANDEKMIMTSNGSFGIGVTSPSAKLDVNGNTRIRSIDVGATSDQVLTVDVNGNVRKVTMSTVGGQGNTDNQDLTLSGNTLSIEGGNSVSLSTLDIDNQDLTLSGNTLSIDGGNSVNLGSLKDNLGNHTASESLKMGTNEIQGAGSNTLINGVEVGEVGFGGSWGGLANKDQATKTGYALIQNDQGITLLNTQDGQKISFRVANDEKMIMTSNGSFGIGVTSPSAKLDVNGNTRIRSIDVGATSDQVLTVDVNGNVRKVTMSTVGGQGNTDNQDLTLSGNTLSIDGGNSVNLGSLKDNLGNHTATTTLQMSKQKIANVGHIEFASGIGAREGYIGNDNNNMQYVAEQGSHLFKGGNVGVGISPSFKLHVNGRTKLDGADAGTWIEAGTNDWFLGRSSEDLRIFNKLDRVTFKPSGYVGIGTSNPTSKLTVNDGNFRVVSNQPNLFLERNGSVGWRVYVSDGASGIDTNDFIIRKQGAGADPAFVINDKTGNVGFGVGKTQGHRIRAKGSIRGTKFVSDNNNYPDYVFDHYYEGSSELNDNYTFPSLEEVEKFTKENGHLPGVSSIKDIEREGGVDISRLGVENLEKVEELYLHIIELNKTIKTLKEENKELNSKLNSEMAQMNDRIEKLSKLVKKSSKQ